MDDVDEYMDVDGHDNDAGGGLRGFVDLKRVARHHQCAISANGIPDMPGFVNIEAIMDAVDGNRELETVLNGQGSDGCQLEYHPAFQFGAMLGEGVQGRVFAVDCPRFSLGEVPQQVVVKIQTIANPDQLRYCLRNYHKHREHPQSAILCPEEFFGEMLFSAYFTRLFHQGLSPHFMVYYAFHRCDRARQTYSFMERIDGSLGYSTTDFARALGRPVDLFMFMDYRVLVFQVLFTLDILANDWISHNDLHADNVFIRRVDVSATTTPQRIYGQEFVSVGGVGGVGAGVGTGPDVSPPNSNSRDPGSPPATPTWSYRVNVGDDNSVVFRVPNRGFIFKIGDLGFATKRAPPVFGNSLVLTNQIPSGFGMIDSWNPGYDLQTLAAYLARYHPNQFTLDLEAYLAGLAGLSPIDYRTFAIHHETNRPMFPIDGLTPRRVLLESGLFDMFMFT